MDKNNKKVVGISVAGIFLAIFGIFFFRVRKRISDAEGKKSITLSQNKNGVYDSNNSKSRILIASKEELESWLHKIKDIKKSEIFQKLFN